MSELPLERARNVAVMRGGALGDFVLTLPVIQALRAEHPEASLTLIAEPQYARLAAPDRCIDLHDLRLAPLHSDISRLDLALWQELAGLNLLIVYTTEPNGPFVANLQDIVGGQVIAADPRPLPYQCVHITEHLFTPARWYLGLETRAGIPLPRIDIDTGARRSTAQEYRHYRRPLVMIHPGSGGRKKCWPLERYVMVTRELRQQGCSVLALAGPVEHDASQKQPGLVYRPSDPFTLARCLSQADLFIGNDAGPGHVAAAVGTPTLTLFGPTRPEIWRPLGPAADIIRADAGELGRLDIDSVVRAACAILRKPSRYPSSEHD